MAEGQYSEVHSSLNAFGGWGPPGPAGELERFLGPLYSRSNREGMERRMGRRGGKGAEKGK